MSDQTTNFGNTAQSLARSPLGIVALFIVLAHGFASLVVAFTSSFSSAERMPLIYFLVVFPHVVLGVFAWLVAKHSSKLFAPSDFKNEENYVKMQMSVVASLSAAAAKNPSSSPEADLSRIVDTVRAAKPATSTSDGWRHRVLWVDDHPENNVYERQAFEALGLKFTLALSTDEALERLSAAKFAAIISDMGRKEGNREGYVLLDQIRKNGDLTPLFFYASSNALEHKRETVAHGGQGCTNNPNELFEMVTKAVIQRQTA